MGLFNFRKREPMQKRSVVMADGTEFAEFLNTGYVPLTDCPEVVSACFKVSQLISSMTIYLMANTERGDIRVKNELSRMIDISPSKNMVRSTWMTAICMNLLLYGNGNSVVYPKTKKGLLESLDPIEANRVSFKNTKDSYVISIDGIDYDPNDLLHFVINPDKNYLWHGRGFEVSLKGLVDNLSQARATEKAFMRSKWKPSVIVRVDALTEEFAGPEGRKKLLKSYVESSEVGEPWLIPGEQFSVEQIRPLTLSDLAINETVTIDKKSVASLLGVPAYLLGVGEYNANEWDGFINNTIRPIAMSIEQELTKKLIISPKMYIMFNMSKLYSYDLQKMSNVYSGLYDKGIITGNEVREKLGMQPKDGLDDLIVLENYIPISDIGNQNKLNGGSKNE